MDLMVTVCVCVFAMFFCIVGIVLQARFHLVSATEAEMRREVGYALELASSCHRRLLLAEQKLEDGLSEMRGQATPATSAPGGGDGKSAAS